jgi:replicative DNA helicase
LKAQRDFSESTFIERVPPHSIEAEICALGSMLLSSDIIPDVMEILNAGSFYREAHRKIFQAIHDLYLRGEAVDPITVAEVLKSRNQLEEVGGKSYLLDLVSSVPTAANAVHYARIVEKDATLRQLIRAATEIAHISYEAPEDVGKVLDKAESLIFGVAKKRISEQFIPLKELVTEAFEEIEKLYEKDTKVTGLPTGFPELDNLTSGLHPSDLIIVAARPAMGKTSFVLGIAEHLAIREKVPVAIFSLEMSRYQLVQRLLCSEARVDAQALRTGRVNDSDWQRLSRAVGYLAEAPLYIDDTPNITILELKAKARRLMTREKLGLIIVDYLQLMQSEARSENRQQEISEISRALKILGRELNVPVIAVSQLSRAVEQRGDKRPMLSDLRESGALEQDADLVIFIYRDEYYNKDNEENRGIAEIIVAKHRNGPTGVINLAFLQNYTKFAPLEMT